MKSKFALALDLLEQEVEVLSKEQQSQFIGGDDYGSNGYDSNGYDSNGYMSNGYCYFNNITYMGADMPGGAGSGAAGGINMTTNAQDYYNQYQSYYNDDMEDYAGSTVGNANSQHMYNFLNKVFTTDYIGTNDTQNRVDQALANGNKVSAVLDTGYVGNTAIPAGHDVAIIKKNASGTYDYYDTQANDGKGGIKTAASLGEFYAQNMIAVTGVRTTTPPIGQ